MTGMCDYTSFIINSNLAFYNLCDSLGLDGAGRFLRNDYKEAQSWCTSSAAYSGDVADRLRAEEIDAQKNREEVLLKKKQDDLLKAKKIRTGRRAMMLRREELRTAKEREERVSRCKLYLSRCRKSITPKYLPA